MGSDSVIVVPDVIISEAVVIVVGTNVFLVAV